MQPEQNNMSNPQSRASGEETHADFSGTKILLCYNYVNYFIFYIILYYTVHKDILLNYITEKIYFTLYIN